MKVTRTVEEEGYDLDILPPSSRVQTHTSGRMAHFVDMHGGSADSRGVTLDIDTKPPVDYSIHSSRSHDGVFDGRNDLDDGKLTVL